MKLIIATAISACVAAATAATLDASQPATVASSALASPNAASSKKPNFVVILTDDQDAQMESLKYMAGVNAHLTQQGTFFPNHYCTVALCCPSRANMWTGKAAHNTNITDLQPPYGGYPKFISEGWNTKWLPTWLQAAGYKTYFTGKLMNSHDITNYKPALNNLSLDGHDFMLQPGTYQYTNTTMQHQQEKPISYPGVYATDLLANRSLAWLDVAAQSDAPFFLAINPVNPHENQQWGVGFTAPVPAPRYANLFEGVKVPRTGNFNPDKPSGASWLLDLKQLNQSEVATGDMYYRRRLQALQAVDDLVNRTIARLEQHNMLDNTFIIYTSDNGFHISQHRLTPGKRCPYEEDVNVPLIIRGPGVPKGQVAQFTTSHTDITPSIVHWAGAKSAIQFDGSPIPINGVTNDTRQVFEHAAIEYWGQASDGQKVPDGAKINTYKALRVIGEGYNVFYSVWCDGSHEVYNMMTDPYQMSNLYNSTAQFLGTSMHNLENRLDALTLVLKSCVGANCTHPWSALQPDDNVQTLRDALNPKYDTFYANQPKVKFEHCALGYFVGNEQPMKFHIAGNASDVEARQTEEWNWQESNNWERAG